MCGRIGQFSAWQSYVVALELFRDVNAFDIDNHPRYNVGPGTTSIVLYPDGTVRRVWWGYRPHWAVARKIPQLINARGDKVDSPTWLPMLKAGRVIVPADCWYEWIKDDDGKKQPYLLRSITKIPLLLAALTNVAADASSGPREPAHGGSVIDGVVIVTDASDAGMLDIHDRRPVVLTPKDAQAWLDTSNTVEHAVNIARTASRPTEDFEWFKAGREVNDARHDDPSLNDPIK